MEIQEQVNKAEQRMEQFRESIADRAEVRIEVVEQNIEDRKGAIENELASRGAA